MMDAVLKPVLYLPFYNFPVRYLDRNEREVDDFS